MIDAYILIIEDGYLSMFLKVPNDLTSVHDGGSMKFIFLKKFSHSDIHFNYWNRTRDQKKKLLNFFIIQIPGFYLTLHEDKFDKVQ